MSFSPLNRFILSLALLIFALYLLIAGRVNATAPAGNSTVTLPVIYKPQTQFSSIALDPFVTGFNSVTEITHAGDERLFVVERDGRILILLPNGTLLPDPFLDIRDRILDDYYEQGLLGLAFHPNYSQNGYFYVYYTTLNGIHKLSRFQADSYNHANPASELQIMYYVLETSRYHNGGAIHFGPDGYLYIAIGDDADMLNGQALDDWFGKILRLDVDEREPYGVPSGNPFYGDDDPNFKGEIWHWGFRNPWRFSFDRLTGEMYIADVGLNTREEISYQPAGEHGAGNYGWACYEGSVAMPPVYCDPYPSEFTYPIFEYSHEDGSCAVIGGYVYRGQNYPLMNGHYLFADLCSGKIWGLSRPDSQNWQVQELGHFPYPWGTFGEDVHGELYIASQYAGSTIFRLRPGP